MKYKHAMIRIDTSMPDYSSLPKNEYDWAYTCYAGAKEEIPKDAPPPRGKSVQTTSYFDANLYHDLVSGKAVTGILHLFNRTPMDWYSKLQSTPETATFGSEFIAAKTCVEQIIDLRLSLQYLGVHLAGPSYVFGDNETVIKSASVPQSRLHKRHNALAYHRVRYAIAADIVRFYWIEGKSNPADVLSKHWDMPSVWDTLKPLMFMAHPASEPKDDKEATVQEDPLKELHVAFHDFFPTH